VWAANPIYKSRRIFYSSAPHVLAKGPAGKKYLVNKVREIKKCSDKIEKPIDRLRFIGLLVPKLKSFAIATGLIKLHAK
jgi:hypothetical protein